MLATQRWRQAICQPTQLTLGHLYGLVREKNEPLFSSSHFNLDPPCLEIYLEIRHLPN